ncbi:sugar ABC transporter substrate-binding protein [Devosia riboflavina]|uniref:sugar ABC transporter substrate-binding protein n=1 Tax=Devosia riboflavina TaxID=46914 RepID=UPI000B1A20A3|nr:sugar ABC transporter substrate-binding protein [Devosia riboflavina]
MKKKLTSGIVAALLLTTSMAAWAQDETLIGLVSITAVEPHNAAYAAGAAKAAEELGWTTSVVDANGSADQANAAVQNFVTRGAKAVVAMIFPPSSLGEGLAAAKAAGVPVVTWGGGMSGTVAATNGSAEPVAQMTLDRMFADIKDDGDILALTYRAGEFCRVSEQMLDAMAATRPNVTIVRNEVRIPGAFEDGAQYANAWLASHPAGRNLAIWSCWDDPAIGAVSSLRQQGRNDVFVYGSNASPQAIEAMRGGFMTASAWQDSYAEGYEMVKVIKTILEEGDGWEPRAAEVPAVLVTRENVEEFVAAHPEVLGH